MSDSPLTLEGHRAIEAAITAQSRPIHQIYIHKKKRYDRTLSRVARQATEAGIPVAYVAADVVKAHTSGNTHGGIVALVGPRRFCTLDDLLGNNPLVVMLDGVEDPFNFGYAVRSLYAAGVDGLVVRPRNWMDATSVVGRSSAGTSEQIPMAVAETAEETAAFFTDAGFTIACTAADERAVSLYDADLTGSLFLLIGGEKRGITRSFIDQADLLLKIPYGRNFDGSLGTVGAASAIAFEALRQRGG